MKVGVDIDGTITVNPSFFKKLISSHLRAGDEVHIITGNLKDVGLSFDYNSQHRATQLNQLGIYDWTVLVVCSATTIDEVAKGKGQYCRDNNIDSLYEDTQSYINAVKLISPLTQTFLIQ